MSRNKKILAVMIAVTLTLTVLFGVFSPSSSYVKARASTTFGDTYIDSDIYTRAEDYKIDDDGYFANPLDRITTSDYTYTPMEMKNHFSKVTVTLWITIREVNDGYQNFQLYNGVESTSTILATTQYEHGPGEVNTSFELCQITFTNVILDNMTANDMVIRYSGSGSNDDDWVNKDLTVTLNYFSPRTQNNTYTEPTKYYDYIRSAEYTIDDAGGFNQPLDRITITDYIGLAPLSATNYVYVTVMLLLKVKEVANGYQYIHLYNGLESNSKLLGSYMLEHGGTSKNTTYSQHVISFINIPLDEFVSNELVIRYDAEGQDDDSWKNKNLRVELQYSYTNPTLGINTKYTETFAAGEEKTFQYNITDTRYYTVETRGSLNTQITIEGLSTGTITDNGSYVGNNARIGFIGEVGSITIKVKNKNESLGGTTILQIRRQQAVMYGYDYDRDYDLLGVTDATSDIDTRPDLDYLFEGFGDRYLVRRYTDNVRHNKSHMLSNDERGYASLNSEIIFYDGHGEPGWLKLPRLVPGYHNQLYYYELPSMENTKLAVWLACKTDYPYTVWNNDETIAQQAHVKGAQTSIGWYDEIQRGDVMEFVKIFFRELEYDDVRQACTDAAVQHVDPRDGIHSWEIYGDGTLRLTDAVMPSRAMSVEVELAAQSFKNRYDGGANWKTVKLRNETRIYRTINGYLTTDYYSLTKSSDGTERIYHSGIFADNLETLDIVKQEKLAPSTISIDSKQLSLTKTDTEIIYCLIDNKLVPIAVNYCDYTSANGVEYGDVLCTNLNTGKTIDYKDICCIGGK